MATDNAKYLMRIASEIGKLANRIERLDERVDKLFEWKEKTELDLADENERDFKIVTEDDPIDSMWGREELRIGEEEIDALFGGKILYHEDGEYAHAIYLKRYDLVPNWDGKKGK